MGSPSSSPGRYSAGVYANRIEQLTDEIHTLAQQIKNGTARSDGRKKHMELITLRKRLMNRERAAKKTVLTEDEINQQIEELQSQMGNDPLVNLSLKKKIRSLKGKMVLTGERMKKMKRTQFQNVYDEEGEGKQKNTNADKKLKERIQKTDDKKYNSLMDAHAKLQQTKSFYDHMNAKASEIGAYPLHKPGNSVAELQGMPYCGLNEDGDFYYPHISYKIDEENMEIIKKVTCRKKVPRNKEDLVDVTIKLLEPGKKGLKEQVVSRSSNARDGRKKETVARILNDYPGYEEEESEEEKPKKRKTTTTPKQKKKKQQQTITAKEFQKIIKDKNASFPDVSKLKGIQQRSLMELASKFFGVPKTILTQSSSDDILNGMKTKWNERTTTVKKTTKKMERSPSSSDSSPPRTSTKGPIRPPHIGLRVGTSPTTTEQRNMATRPNTPRPSGRSGPVRPTSGRDSIQGWLTNENFLKFMNDETIMNLSDFQKEQLKAFIDSKPDNYIRAIHKQYYPNSILTSSGRENEMRKSIWFYFNDRTPL